MLAGLQMPHLTDPDPELYGEGNLDPLGLASLANLLADEIAPGVTARMRRIRFLTGIAVSSSVTQGLFELPPGDGVSMPYHAFEWHVVTALARAGKLPTEALAAVPGIEKARASISQGRGLDHASYLKAPKVFGFVGVYKQLARAIGLIDENLILTERGDQLLRLWERDHDLNGFADRTGEGRTFAMNVANAVRDTYGAGRVTTPAGSLLWGRLAATLRPDGATEREKQAVLAWLLDDVAPMRREMIQLLSDRPASEDENISLRAIRSKASAELAMRLEAIDAYERVAELLTRTIDAIRYVSTSGDGPMPETALAKSPIISAAARELAAACERATSAIDLVNPSLTMRFETVAGSYHGLKAPAALVEAILARHEAVQRAKGATGKRPWFERTPSGVLVRLPYRTDDEPALDGSYVHPYRVGALAYFIRDLR